MKIVLGICCFFLLFSGCQAPVTSEDLANLNGYWEIEKVVADGNHKDYKVNETIDLFEVAGMSGTRRKVMPQFSGGYLNSGGPEQLSILLKDDKAFIQYKTAYSQWREEIVELSKENLVLRGENSVEYRYKRHVPFSLK